MTIFFNDLEALISAKPVAVPKAMPMDAASVRIRETCEKGFNEKCKACGGSGRFYSYTGRLVGNCFKCSGKGSKTFATSPETRAKATVARTEKKLSAVEAFEAAHPGMIAYLAKKAETFTFAASLHGAVFAYGNLTDRQLAAAENMMAKDASWEADKTARTAARIEAAPAVDVTKIVTAIVTAQANGLKAVKVKIAGYTFAPAKATSANAGAIYAKTTKGGVYLGKIMAGKWLAARECSAEQSAEIIAIAADPAAAAKAHGIKTGECSCCGRTLTNSVSISLGIGPICASKFGF